MKKTLAFLAILTALVWAAVFSFPDNSLHLIFCDVGQGDAILVKKGFNQVLIDAGPDERVLGCLSENLPFWDRTLEMVVLTHPQADHLTGFISVLERYHVRHFVINNLVNDSERFWRFRETLIEEKTKIYSPKAGERIEIAGISFNVLWPQEKFNSHLGGVLGSHLGDEVLSAATYAGNFNETSIVLRLSFGKFDALLTGDISAKIEKEIIGEFHTEPVEVLKVAHHGSKYSTSTDFLKQVRPALAAISVGKNSFGHPTSEVLERLTSAGTKILRTDQNGAIEIVSDGKKWRIKVAK